MKAVLLPLIAALALAASGAAAHDKPKPLASFDAYDANNDGVITKREATGHPNLRSRFNAIDTDDNGRISHKEWRAARAKDRADSRFSALDRNKDGVLNRAEARNQLGGSASAGR